MATANDSATDFDALWEALDTKVKQAKGICSMLVGHQDVAGRFSDCAWTAEDLLTSAEALLAQLHEMHKADEEVAHG